MGENQKQMLGTQNTGTVRNTRGVVDGPGAAQAGEDQQSTCPRPQVRSPGDGPCTAQRRARPQAAALTLRAGVSPARPATSHAGNAQRTPSLPSVMYVHGAHVANVRPALFLREIRGNLCKSLSS